MAPWLLLEAGLRGAFVAVLLLLAGLLWRGHGRSWAGRLSVAVALGCAAYGVQSALRAHGLLQPWQWPLQLLMTGNPVLIWLLAEALFNDDHRPRRWHAALWLAWAGGGTLVCYLHGGNTLGRVFELGPLFFSALALRAMALSWRDDLVEGRPAVRRHVFVGLVGYTVLSTLAGSTSTAWAGVLDAAVLLALAGAAAWPLLALRPAPALPAWPEPAADAEAQAVAGAPPKPTTEAAPDPAALARLQRAMQEQQLWRREGLTIGQLAAELNLPEYRLRRAINGQLGHRNFSAFLAGHRIQFARAELSNPAQPRRPVLEIALAAGYQSLGPFNRAFKAATGQTPTEFRQQALGSALPNSEIGQPPPVSGGQPGPA